MRAKLCVHIGRQTISCSLLPLKLPPRPPRHPLPPRPPRWHLLPLLENLESMGPEMIEKITETLKSECENKHGLCHRDKNNYSPSHFIGRRFHDVCQNHILQPEGRPLALLKPGGEVGQMVHALAGCEEPYRFPALWKWGARVLDCWPASYYHHAPLHGTTRGSVVQAAG